LASGPAAGVTGAAYLATKAGFPNIISFDVGGTSTDVCLIEGGSPVIAKEREVAGYPLRFPMVDVHSAGAGGGSIAWVDSGGFLHVGPHSAGANPGPACYDLGGREPTVTDAQVVLGRLPPDALLGGRMPIRAELARRAIEEKVSVPMGLGTEEAAQGILTILNEKMLQAVRVISVEQGFDPRAFSLFAFGGAGPLLASPLARELGIATVVVPVSPGVLCALGLLVADLRSDFSLTRIMNLEDSGVDRLNDAFARTEGEAAAWFEREGIAAHRQRIDRAIDMRYVGQSHELTIAVQAEALKAGDIASISAAFRKEHERVYGYASDAPVQLVTFRVTTSAQVTPPPVIRLPAGTADSRSALRGERRVHFNESEGYVECPVYDRALIPTGTSVDGPAIFEQMDTTTVVHPGQRARCDDLGNLVLTFM
jgi:N-methylhydantoinase A